MNWKRSQEIFAPFHKFRIRNGKKKFFLKSRKVVVGCNFRNFYPTKVKSIDASGNKFENFAVAFVSLPELESLDLSKNNFSTLTTENLQRFSSKTQVNISENPLDDASRQLALKFNFLLWFLFKLKKN